MIRIIAQTEPVDDVRKRYNLPEEDFEEITPQDLMKGQDIPLADLEDNLPQEQTTMTPAELGPEWSPRPEETQPEVQAPEEAEVPPFPTMPEEAPEAPEEQAPAPEEEYEELTEEETELDRLNKTYSIDQKIDASLAEGYPLRIIYTTLKGHTTERTIRPDYYLPARSTGNWVLIAWCELRNDWRGFIANRIRAAKLEPK